MGFDTNLKVIRDGETVNAATANRALLTLGRRTNDLREKLDATRIGEAYFDNEASISSEVVEGAPVYWNIERQRYEPALAGITANSDTGELEFSASALCLGLCHKKLSDKTANIVLRGIVTVLSLPPFGDTPAGWYYLSPTTAGELQTTRPGIPIPVCYVFGPISACESGVRVLVDPLRRDVLDDHVHLRFPLRMVPAGDINVAGPGEEYAISDADSTVEGWLPANHTIFEGRAPLGAKFGYNLSVAGSLNRAWPPTPASNAVVEWWRQDMDHRGFVGVLPEQVRCTDAGIWWFNACHGQAPWPDNYENIRDISASLSISAADSSCSDCVSCDEVPTARMMISFIRTTLGTSRQIVTSVQPGADQPIEVRNCAGENATAGDLYLFLNLAAKAGLTDAVGSQVVKAISNSFVIDTGRMLEGLIAGSSRVTITSTHQRRLTPGDTSTALVHQGIVTVDLDPNPIDLELPVVINDLQDVEQGRYRDVPLLLMHSSRDSSVSMRVDIPGLGVQYDTPTVRFNALILGTATGTLPALTLSYKRIARPISGGSVSVPSGWTAVTFTADVSITVDTAKTITSDPITVVAGDTLVFLLSRAAAAGYAGDVGLLRNYCVLAGA